MILLIHPLPFLVTNTHKSESANALVSQFTGTPTSHPLHQHSDLTLPGSGTFRTSSHPSSSPPPLFHPPVLIDHFPLILLRAGAFSLPSSSSGGGRSYSPLFAAALHRGPETPALVGLWSHPLCSGHARWCPGGVGWGCAKAAGTGSAGELGAPLPARGAGPAGGRSWEPEPGPGAAPPRHGPLVGPGAPARARPPCAAPQRAALVGRGPGGRRGPEGLGLQPRALIPSGPSASPGARGPGLRSLVWRLRHVPSTPGAKVEATSRGPGTR